MKKHVLLVEDDLLNQKIIKIMLEKIGCKVDICGTAQEALDKIHNIYHIIFTDLGLPDMNGFELIKQITKIKKVPIIAFTGRAGEKTRQECLQIGCKEALTKPIFMDQLISIINDI